MSYLRRRSYSKPARDALNRLATVLLEIPGAQAPQCGVKYPPDPVANVKPPLLQKQASFFSFLCLSSVTIVLSIMMSVAYDFS